MWTNTCYIKKSLWSLVKVSDEIDEIVNLDKTKDLRIAIRSEDVKRIEEGLNGTCKVFLKDGEMIYVRHSFGDLWSLWGDKTATEKANQECVDNWGGL